VNAAVLWGLLAGAALSPDAPHDAAVPPFAGVEAVGACPGSDAVRAALRPIIVSGQAAPGQASQGQLEPPLLRSTARVSDLGERFEVTVVGQTGLFVDARRDCAERARVAAVFIALAVNPPTVAARPGDTTAASPGAAPVPAITSPPEPSGPPGRWLAVALAARVDGSTGGDSTMLDVGGGPELRVAAGRGAFGLAAGAGLLTPTHSAFGTVRVREQRIPLSLSVTASRALRARLAAAADVGVALVPFTLRGEGLGATATATRLDVGARVALALRGPPLWGRVAPLADVHAEWFPRTYTLAVDPLGRIGASSHLWLGAALGFSFETASPLRGAQPR
jgi:hypothetical protein